MRWLILLGFLLLSVGCLVYQTKAVFFVDSDEGIVGLMALHINQGRSIPMFYYGQHYIGPLEPLVASFIFSLFGSSSLTLKLAPFLFTLISLIIGASLVRDIGGSRAAVIFLLLFAIPGQFMTEWFCKARGNFSYTIFATALTSLILHRYQGYKAAFWLGAFIGFSWWQNGQITSLAAALGLFFALRKKLSYFVVGFGVGLFPVIVYNLVNNFATFEQLGKRNLAGFFENISAFFTTFLPILLGFARTFQNPGLSASIPGLILILSVIYGLRARSELVLKVNALNVIVFVILFSTSDFGKLANEPRYGMSIWFSATLLASLLLAKRGYLGILALAIIVPFRVKSYFVDGQFKPTGTQFIAPNSRVPRDTEALVDQLLASNVTRIRTPYWNAYNLFFVSRERIVGELVREPYTPRFRYFEHGDLVSIPVLDHESTAKYYRELSERSGLQLETEKIWDKMSLFKFSRKAYHRVANLTLVSSYNLKDLPNLVDDNLDSYWHAEQPVNDGVLLALEQVGCAKGLQICVSKFEDDFPQRVLIKHSAGQETMDESWINFLKSSRCLDFLFNNQVKGRIEFIVQNSEYKRFSPSLSEIKIIACE